MAPNRTWRIWPFGLALLESAAFGRPDDSTSTSGLCFYPDGSLASDQLYIRCTGAINDDICCPLGSACVADGFCSSQGNDGYDVVFRGACKTQNYDKDCYTPCDNTNPGGIAFILPCGGNNVCCGVSEEDSCCANKFFWAFASAFEMKSPSDSEISTRTGKGIGSNTQTWSSSTTVAPVTTTQTTTTTDTSTSVPASELENIRQHDAKKLVAIGAGLGVGGALLIVGIIGLICWHVKRKKKRRNQSGVADKSLAGSEGMGTSLANTPVDQSQSTNFSSLSPVTHPSQQQQPTLDTFPTHEPPRSVSPLPPAPPYSPPQYESGDYQYLVVDGPMPGHSNGPGPGSGGLPVGPDGKPRLED